MTLAQQAGIRAAATMPLRVAAGHAVAIERFDRARGRRIHCLTAHVALRAADERFGYPELAQLLRRRGVTAADRYVADMHELFRRMVFNILIDNTDDHEKNHALLVTDAQQYELAPAYDVLPSGQALGFQQMRVGELEADSTIANALSMAQLFELSDKQAVAQVRRVARVVAGWRQHFASCGVTQRDIDATRRADRSTVSRGPAPRVPIKTRGEHRWQRTQRSRRSCASSPRSRNRRCARPTSAAVTITASTSRTFALWPKRLKTQHELALALWATGDTAARLLATLVCKPKALSAAELDAMIRDIRSPKLLDWFIVNMVKPGRHAEELRVRWKDGKNLVGRAGWSLTTDRVVKNAEGLDLEALLDQIEKEMKQAPERSSGR